MAEFIVMFYQALLLKKELEINKYIKDIFPFFVKALIMFILIFPINFLKIENFLKIIIQIVFGIMIYCFFNKQYLLYLFSLKKNHK